MAYKDFSTYVKEDGTTLILVSDVVSDVRINTTYRLDTENCAKLETLLRKESTGSLSDMLEQKFGSVLDETAMKRFFKNDGIVYEEETEIRD